MLFIIFLQINIFDRNNFFQNLLLDNLLLVDIYNRAKKLRIEAVAPRAVFLVRQIGHSDVAIVDVLSGLFPDKLQDFVLSINETDIAVVRQVAPDTDNEELCRIARIKSADMRDNRYFAHESPTYGRIGEMLKRFGYRYSAAGENIAHHANVDKAQAAFMSSQGHRANILSTTCIALYLFTKLKVHAFFTHF